MSQETIRGVTQKGVGAVKETLGRMTGNRRLQAEGVKDKVVGSAKEAFGRTKDAVHRATR